MSKETILLVGDSLQGPTGFATDLAGVCWSLADKYDVHALGLQSFRDEKITLTMQGKSRNVIQHANQPRSQERYDFGTRSLPMLMDKLEPDILLTVNDIQMIQHVPNVMCPPTIQVRAIDLPSKTYVDGYAMEEQIKGQMQKYKEKFPRETKWIAYCPQDGDPPMQNWKGIYSIADKVVAMSKYGQGVFKNYLQMDVPYIYHGVDTELFKPQDNRGEHLKDKVIFGNFNRNQPRKQPVRCIRSFAKFAKDKDDVLLHMQMDWRDQFGWPLDYFVKLYGINNKIINPMPAGMSRENVAAIYSQWDVNLMPTAGEGFGLCTIEGFACGVPCIHTDYTTGRELLRDGYPNPRGLLAGVKDMHWEKLDVAAVQRALVDEDDMAHCMQTYYDDPDLRKRHGENARKWTEKFCSWDVIAKNWHKMIEDILSS